MPRYRSSIEVSVPVPEAFAFVTDFRNAARWDPRVVRAEKTTDGPVGLGTRFRLVSFGLGKEVPLPYEVTAFEESERAVIEGRTLLFRYRDRLDFGPLPDSGGTRLTYDARLSLRGPLALGNPLLALVFRRIGDDALAGIRRGLLALAREQDGEPPAGLAPPTPEEVRRIVAMDEQPVLRNLHITLAYHRLSSALASLFGPASANWCTYAAWASKTAGVFIREEELRGELRRLLERKGRVLRRLRSLHRALHAADPEVEPEPDDDLGPILEVVDEVGRFIREGNRVVFEELGGLFAELLVELGEHPEPGHKPDWERFERFLERLRPGPVEPDLVERTAGDGGHRVVSRPRGGQDLLRESMRCYYAARFETEPKTRAELLLLGNALGGIHEQTRLQGCIAGALDAPVEEILYSRMNDALVERLGRKLLGPAQEALHRLLVPLGEEVAELVREVSTRFLMRLAIPGEVLELGEDHPAPPGGPPYPPILATIEHPELAATLDRYGAEPTTTAGLPLKARLRTWVVTRLARLGLHRAVVPGSAAVDWTELRDRMRYIFVYFRSRQVQESLLEAPFDRVQVEEILAGRVPEGPL